MPGILKSSRSLPDLTTLLVDYPPLPRSPSTSPPPELDEEVYGERNGYDKGKAKERADGLLFERLGYDQAEDGIRSRIVRDTSEEYTGLEEEEDELERTARGGEDDEDELGAPVELDPLLLPDQASLSPTQHRLRLLNHRHKRRNDEHQSTDDDYRSPSPLSSSASSPSPSSPSAPFVHQTPSSLYARSPSPADNDERRKKWDGYRMQQIIPFSLWDYLQEEVLAVEMDGEEGVKSERVTNFLTVPGEVEKIIGFGFVICLDSFLYNFTILPLRVITAFSHLVSNLWFNLFTRSKSSLPLARRHLRLSHKCDLVKAVITMGTLVILHRITDASQMYHSVRGQETLKLYVIFNVLEIADRLCCSFGQDLQDSLFSRQTLGRRVDGSHPRIRPVALVGLNLAYVVAHTLVLFYQLVTLNVAINSYSNALLTLLLSNQFVEIKGAVFKKFEKEQLFQVTCADIVERFQLAIMLFIIALRNLIELSSASSSSLFSFLPASFSLTLTLPSLPTLSLIQTIFSPAVIVLLSECAVDWLKHAFITKFNHIRPAVYGRFIDVLCKDLVGGASRRRDQPFVDQSPIVSRRLGFAALPLGCLVVRVIFQAFEMLTDDSHVDECAPVIIGGGRKNLKFSKGAFLNGGSGDGGTSRINGIIVVGLGVCVAWACLIALKLLIGINLRAFASSRYATMESRVQEDQLNDRSRPHIGTTAQEKELDRANLTLLSDRDFDVPGKKGNKISMETLGRYDMIKSRVW